MNLNHRENWGRSYQVIWLLIVAMGLFLRFYQLDQRPLHHDESLHGIYGLYFFQDRFNQFYRYDPMLHGPVLYHLIPYFYFILDISKETLRFLSASIGSLILISPILFRNTLKPLVVVSITAMIAFSPTMVYWSRFLRHDGLVLLSMILSVWGFTFKNKSNTLVVFSLGAALHFCIKENAYLHMAMFLTYLIYEAIYLNFISKSTELFSSIEEIAMGLKQRIFSCLLAVLIFALVYSYFYSAGFQYIDGIWDGLYRKSLVYWFNQHSIERISGPFSYTFLINSFYELWWVPLLLIHVIIFYKGQTWLTRLGFIFALTFSLMGHFISNSESTILPLFQFLKIKIPLDYYLFFPLVYHAVVSTSVYLGQNNRLLAILSYSFFTSLFVYSYVGEKVPWLAIYPLFWGIIFFSVYCEKMFSWLWVSALVIICSISAYHSYKLNILESGRSHHLISQVQTSPEFEELLYELSAEINAFPGNSGPKVLAMDYTIWPTVWYLYGKPGFHFHDNQMPKSHYKYILGPTGPQKLDSDLEYTHDKKIIDFRVYWDPDWRKFSFAGAIRYALYKTPWSPVGKTSAKLYIRKPFALLNY